MAEIETVLHRQSALVFRAEEGSPPVVEGRIVPYGQWSEVDSVVEGHFMEQFAPGSFSKTLAERRDEMKVYFNHGRSQVFDEMPVGVLRSAWEAEGNDGLWWRAELLDGLPDLFMSGLRQRQYGSSIGAQVVKMTRNRKPGKSDHNPDGIEERVYKEMRAFDFTITPRPHYIGELALRSTTDELLIDKILEHRGASAILRAIPVEDAEPPHSEPTEQAQEDPVPDESPEESRRTQVRDYLNPKEAEPSWRLTND